MLVFLCFTLCSFGGAVTVQSFQTSDPEPICQKNEHYVQETASCQKTCLNYRQVNYAAEACKPFTGCQCDDEFVRLYDDATGPCVLTKECDYFNCNEDSNATYKQCPRACPPTCDAPDAILVCKKMCLQAGCECKPGYIRSQNDGYCIRPDDCPGGDPCRGNQTFVACKVGCPTNYCPVDDRRAIVACSPPFPCPPGCSCKSNHLRLSREDGRCILASECPKVKCTRPNEEWSPCASNCLAERCSDIGNDNSNCRPYSYCRPQCVCKEGFYRNSSDICIPARGCLCQENEQYVENSTVCQKTCGNRFVSGSLESCEPFTGCTCTQGFVRPYDNATGPCIPVSECAPIPTKCGFNEEPTSCKAICPPQSCAISYTTYICEARQCEPGCNCIENYLRNSSEICILNDDCPPPQPWPENEHYVKNSTERQKTCGNRLVSQYVEESPPFTGYVCDDGYVRLYDNATGPCIPITDCAPIPTNCGYNEQPTSCKQICPPQSCAIAYTDYRCEQRQCEPGCNCIENFLRNSSEICIFNEDCFPPQPPENEHYVQNSTERQKTCGNRLVSRYVEESKPYTGYVCNDGYVRLYDNATGPCIPVTDCDPIPKQCGYNEEPTSCKITCPPESCDISYTTYLCAEPHCDPGCNCIQNHLRNSSQICILAKECPPPRPFLPECGPDEMLTDCKELEPLDTCESLSDVNNTNNKRVKVRYINDYCTPGCRCRDNYRRNSLGFCIPIEECPLSLPDNEHYVYNNSECQKTCGNRLVSGSPEPCKSFTGYVCDDGYVRPYDNATGSCILENDCEPIPINCGLNEEPSSCKVACAPQSCDISYTTYICENRQCTPGCNCIENYLRNSSGVCILNDDCPPQQQAMTCGGDRNATYKECPMPCPLTCASPNAISKCTKMCSGFGCECQPGYILSASDGICILPEDCPDGNPCGENGTLSDCSFRCPNQYCPEDDSRITILCKPGRPCPPGCMCKENYMRISSQNDTCVLANDCPKINCTRQNEIWDPCSSECLAEKCEDMYQPNPCSAADNPGCKPRCVCAKGHFRDGNDACVPDYECPNYIKTPPPSTTEPCSVTDQNYDTTSDSSSCSSSNTEYKRPRRRQCIRTCAEPNPKNCRGTIKNRCKAGYILTKRGGKCIKIENCPKNIGCNGDKQALVKECPLACPPTCADPNYNPCKKQCEPVGCECQPGYLLSEENGKCILPNDCKGGNPCGPNATFTPCKSGCPTDYCPVDDRRARVICETFPFSPCYPGCACKLNYKLKSQGDRRCILSYECPEVNCTRPYEEWSSCPSACLAEFCEDVYNQPSTCNTLVFNCDPKCICIKNHFRNGSEICIPAKNCPTVTVQNT